MRSVFKILRSLSFLQNTFINERIERAQRLEGLVEKDSRVRKLPLELAANAEKKKGTAQLIGCTLAFSQQSSLDYFGFILCPFRTMEYISFGSFLIARSLNISAQTHFGQIFKALKLLLLHKIQSRSKKCSFLSPLEPF